MKRRAFSEVTKSRSSSGSFPSFDVMRVSYDTRVRMPMQSVRYNCIGPNIKNDLDTNESLHSPDQCNLLQGRMAFSPTALPIHIPYSKRRRVCHIRDMPT